MIGIAPAVQWTTGSPLWGPTAPDPATIQRPALLRFTTDDFMPALIKMLASEPGQLAGHVADARSYRRRPPGAPASWTGDLPAVKLYQAAHGHFNLVAASLVCRMPGLPDRTLDVSSREEVGFVLRRLVPPDPDDTATATTLIEAAWVDDPAEGKGWRTIAGEERRVAAGEEILTLFPLNHGAGSDRTRRVLVGLIPTSSAESFKASGTLSPISQQDPLGTAFDARKDDFETRVFEPIVALRDAPATDPFPTASAELRKEASAFVFLDFAELLVTHMPAAWTAIQSSSPPASGAVALLYSFLQNTVPGGTTLRAAILDAWEKRLRILDEADPKPTYTIDLRTSTFSIDTLRTRVHAALPSAGSATAASPAPEVVGIEEEVPKLPSTPGTLFVVRCVFRRPCERPAVDVIGEPSEQFTIASFFDLDAPARPVRIQLPVQTSMADLRKYPKNVGFVLSAQLREQMQRATEMKAMIDKQLASGEAFDVGQICSFSLPIITIVALILLMVVVSLLNIVFWWMPFLKICLPISLSGKRT